MMSKLGVYIHIPFCLRKCNYCDFLSFGADEYVYGKYKNALLNEIANTPELNREIDTIYIGGGTPSILPPIYIADILTALEQKKDRSCEVTLEANPATVTAETLAEYKHMGINRLSIGLQSANNTELEFLGRLHNCDDFRRNFFAARAAGFDNISIDIMFSLPNQNLDSWSNTVEQVAALEPEHISAYGLIIEPGTVLSDSAAAIDESLDREMYKLVCETLGKHGYERYEISNFSKPGFHSRHNTKYWTRAEYIGIGLGAHSFMDETRWRNTNVLSDYIANNGFPDKIRHDIQQITKPDAMAEFMFLGLRLSHGVGITDFHDTFGNELYSVYGTPIEKHISLGTLTEKHGCLFLTEKGINVSNIVMSDFL